MSTIREIIARVDDVKINAFGEEVKMAWIAELDGKIALDVMLMSIEDVQQLQYKSPDDLESTPLVKFPHDSLYDLWLGAKIDFANGEYSKYQNSMEMFNAHYGNYVRWFAQFYEPAQGYARDCRCYNNPPYYISAYSLAVSRGFDGSLDEWLASLVGKKVAIRYDGDKIFWRWVQEGEESADPDTSEEWAELIDVDALQKTKPVKGVDYFTPEDIAILKQYYIPVGEQDFGHNNTVSAKGYFFTEIDFTTKEITLSTSQKETTPADLVVPWQVGDELSLKNANWHGHFGKIVAVNGNKITVDTLPFTKIESALGVDADDHCIFAFFTTTEASTGRVFYHVRSGEVEFANYAHSFGYNSEVGTKGGINTGANNKILPAGGPSATGGSENQVTASNSVAVNYKNDVHADNSFIGGMRNIIHRVKGSGTNFLFAYMSELWGNFCAIFGSHNKILSHSAKGEEASSTIVAGRFLNARGSGQLVCGEYNEDDGTAASQGGKDQNSYFVVGGGTASKRKSVFRVRRTGNTDLCGNNIENLKDGTELHHAVNKGQLDEHKNAANPHGLTPEGIGAASGEALAAHINASNPHKVRVGVTREFDSTEDETDPTPSEEYEYKGNAALLYNILVSYEHKEGGLVYDTFTVDWRMLGLNFPRTLRRYTDYNANGTYYAVAVSKNESGRPYFVGWNCTIERVVGYY